MNKKAGIFSAIFIFIVVCTVGYYFMFGGGQDKKVKEEYQKYVDMINITHDFDSGSKGLDKLTTDTVQKLIPTIKSDIKAAKELKNTAISLEGKKIDDARESLDRAVEIDVEKTFLQAENWLRNDIDNYGRAKEEIENLAMDSNFRKNVSQVLEKYNFNYSNLKQELSDLGSSILEKVEEATKKAEEVAERAKQEIEEKKKKSDVELGGPNPALLDDRNSLPADAQGIGGAIDEAGMRKLNSEMVALYQGYLLRKYDGESIEWAISGKAFKIIKANGESISFSAQPELYAKVGNRLVTGVRLTGSEGTEFLYRT